MKGYGMGTSVAEMVASAEARQGDTERAAQVLDQAEEALGVVVQDIPLDAIEPDPAQPRRVFEEDKLQSLAASIKKYGLLQEPGVVAVAADRAGLPTHFRLIWGERRWRAARIAGLRVLRCKVLPCPDESAAEQLRTKEKQWAENMEREGLTPIEEAIAIQDAVDIERKLGPDVPVGELVEKVGAQRGLNGMVARNLVSLLKTPRCLQTALMGHGIGREVGFELTRYWNKLVAEDERRRAAKREIQFRNLVEAWAAARWMDLNAEAMAKYAAETFQDPKVVKATCRKAEEAQRAVLERFAAIVERAQKQKWTVARAKILLGEDSRAEGAEPEARLLPLFEQTGRRQTRFTIYLDRVRDPSRGTPEALAELKEALQALLREFDLVPQATHSAPAGDG
jgi:ParB family chromosome partitioning protein